MKKSITVRVDETIMQSLEFFKQHGLSKTAVIERAVDEYFRKYRKQYTAPKQDGIQIDDLEPRLESEE